MSTVPGQKPTLTLAEAAEEERSKLKRTFRRFDMIFFTVCALVGLDTLGAVSSAGPEAFSWLMLLAVAFLLPYALVMSELGSAFPFEGGPYVWMKLAFGRLTAGLGSVLYWITNPLWVGGSLCFLATEAWSANISSIGSGTVGDYAFKLGFIWLSIIVAIVSLERGKWIPNVGAIVRILVLGFFSITVIVYAIENGLNTIGGGDFVPSDIAIFLAVVPIILFNYVGFELQTGAAEEMVDPQKDVPITVVRSGLMAVLMYGVPIFGILTVLPDDQISGLEGFMNAVTALFSVYGGAAATLVDLMTLGFIFALLTSGSVWMIGSDRVLAIAAIDGAFPAFFGRFHRGLGTPVRANLLSGVISTLFMFAAVNLLTGSSASSFTIVLYLATSTTLLSYLLIFPAAWRLRRTHGEVERPYHVPGGSWGMGAAVILCTAWMTLGSWVALFPGTLERLAGLEYDIASEDNYGVSRLRFEAFTLGTLAVILAIGVIGYLLAARDRAREVALPLPTAARPATGD